MAHYSISELYDAKTSGQYPTLNFLFGADYSPKPNVLKDYLNNYGDWDSMIVNDYGDYKLWKEFDSETTALAWFRAMNYNYYTTHSTELSNIYSALTATFNPVENYDRTESTTVTTDMTVDNDTTTSGSNTTSATENASASVYGYDSSTANPSDSSTGTSSGTSSSTGSVTNSVDTDGTVTTASRIHGNIGVTSAIDLISQSVDYFSNNSYYDYLVGSLVRNVAVLIDDDDYNII